MIRATAAEELSRGDVRQFASLLASRKWTIVGVTGIVLGAVLLLSFRQTPVYASKASVLVEFPSSNTSPTGPNMSTEKQIASSTAVADMVIKSLHVAAKPDQVLAALSVNVPVDSEVLEFTYSDHRPQIAQRRADAFAEAYLEFRRQQLLDELVGSERFIQDRIRSLTAQLGTIQKEAARQKDPGPETVLRAEASSIITQIGILQTKLTDLTPSDGVLPGKMLEPAVLPLSPSSPNFVVNSFLGIMGGLMFGVFAAMLREHTDDSLRGRQDLELQMGTPVLAAIPSLRGLNGLARSQLVTLNQPDTIAGEAFRQLRARFGLAAGQQGAKSVLVTSCGEKEGKTFTVANLGVALARSGKRVILVSTDFRQPRLEQLFGLSASAGLADVLLGNDTLKTVIQDVGLKNLAIIPTGSIPDNPAELLASGMLPTIIRELHPLVDFILVDCAPLLPVADASVVAVACDAVLFVADARSATRARLSDARQQMERMHANVLGAVLVKASAGDVSASPYH
jgi:capsular exopolysaccharide synthesis family protein